MRDRCIVLALSTLCAAAVFDFEADGGAEAGDDTWDTVISNGAKLNSSLSKLRPGDTFVVPTKTFHLMGGIHARNLHGVTISIDGTLIFASSALNSGRYMKAWPRGGDGGVLDCLTFSNLSRVNFTSASRGELDGGGAKWWGLPGIGYLRRQEDRPRLLTVLESDHVLVERLHFRQSPYWTFLASGVTNLEVRYSRVDNRRTHADRHDLLDLTAFNTDGFDLADCDTVWIHHCEVWNQDDCFDVKDGTNNVLIEHVNASGFGLTIGSIASDVRNITFRHARMVRTVKGIYMKFRGAGSVRDVLYEDIVIEEPQQFAIWIGPAQQCDGCSLTDLCSTDGGPCSICWPTVPGTRALPPLTHAQGLARCMPWGSILFGCGGARVARPAPHHLAGHQLGTHCHAPAGGQYSNITLRDITVLRPKQSAGVLLADEAAAMRGVRFDNVVVHEPAARPFGDEQYYCRNVHGVATGATSPVPPCFEDRTGAVSARAERF